MKDKNSIMPVDVYLRKKEDSKSYSISSQILYRTLYQRMGLNWKNEKKNLKRKKYIIKDCTKHIEIRAKTKKVWSLHILISCTFRAYINQKLDETQYCWYFYKFKKKIGCKTKVIWLTYSEEWLCISKIIILLNWWIFQTIILIIVFFFK